MAQVEPTNRDMDPITQAFVADRMRFWGGFTRFTFNGVIGVAVLLVLLWWFLV